MKKLFGKITSMMGPYTSSLQIRVKQGHQITTIPCNPGSLYFTSRLKPHGHNK